MRKYTLKAYPLMLLLVVACSTFAQTIATGFSYTLVATKNTTQKVYKPGSRFFIKYKDSSIVKTCRGVFTGVTEGKILLTNRKGDVGIYPAGILVLRKIRPKRRILFAGIGTALVAGGAALFDNNGESVNEGSAIRDAFLIPVIGIGVYFLAAIPVSLLIENAKEKKGVNGWQFRLDNGIK